jgi:hypothetical protein
MNPILQTVSINDFCKDYKIAISLATKAPVFLTVKGNASGVLVSVAGWNELLEQVEARQDVIDVLEAELALAHGEDEYVEMTEEYRAELQAIASGTLRSR